MRNHIRWNRRARLYLGGACLCIVALTVAVIRLASGGEAALAGPANAGRGDALRDDATANPFDDAEPGASGFDGRVDREQLIKDYLEWSQYPPDSRPLFASHVDRIEYRRIAAPLQPMPATVDGEVRRSDFSCLLQPEHHSVLETERMRVFLSCTRTGERAATAIRLRDYRLEARAGERRFRPAPPAVNDAGENGDEVAGDRVLTFEFRPSAKDWGDMHLTVNFEIPGDAADATYSLTTHFFSSPTTPARFTGQFREELRDGSLLVEAGMRVERAGPYTIEANLMNADGEPVAYARAEVNLKAGVQFVPLSFYGKILRDANQSGPFRVVGLRGELNTDVIQPEVLARSPAEVERFLAGVRDDRPKRMLVPYFTGTHTTARYDLSAFTDAEYDSIEKTRRLSELSALP